MNVYNGHPQPPHYDSQGSESMGRSASDSGLKKDENENNFKERRPSDNKFIIRQNSNKKLHSNGTEGRAPSREKAPLESPMKKGTGIFSNGKMLERINIRRNNNPHLTIVENNRQPSHSILPESGSRKHTSSLSNPMSLPTQGQNPLRLSGNQKNMSQKSKGHHEELYFKNYAVKTKAGCSQRNVSKTNQDSFIYLPNFDPVKQTSLFGILDGHGIFGHHVSQFVKAHLPKLFSLMIKHVNDPTDEDYSLALASSFTQTLEALQKSSIDCFVSGTTAVVCLITRDKIYCANAGDSRAVMLREEGGLWTAEALSEDHKPDLEPEKKRILHSGGRVEPFRDFQTGEYVGPARVWLKKENVPGLAMARSIGDLLAGQVGVTANPEVKIFHRTPNDKILLIASDGLWEFYSNDEVKKLSYPYYGRNDPEALCDKLISESNGRWMVEDDVIDDTTVVAVFF